MKVKDLFNYQNDAMHILKHSYDKGKLFHAYILNGDGACGTVDAAIYMVKQLLCKKDNAPCMACLDCKRIDSESHLNYIHVKPINDMIRKEQIEHIIKEFSMTSLEEGPQIYIIEDADKMNASATNALLKFLEEPNPNHYAFLTTTSINKLLDTVISRCQVINFKPIPQSYLIEKLINCGVVKDIAYLVSMLTIDFDEAMNIIEEGKVANIYTVAKKIVIKDLNQKDAYIEYFRNRVIFQEEKDKAYHRFFLDTLILIYQEILKKKTFFETAYFEEIMSDEFIDIYDTDEIIRKLELLNTYQERFNYNVNLDLQYTSLFSKL